MLPRATGTVVVVKPRAGVRPTTRKVVEAMFSILDHMLDGWDGVRVLDAFAGAGQLGLEALERGADLVLFVEKDSAAAADLRREVARRGWREQVTVLRADAREAMTRVAGPFQLVFVDPPYSVGLAATAVQVLGARGVVDGVLVAEHHHKDAMPESAGTLQVVRRERYGETCLTFYRAGREGDV